MDRFRPAFTTCLLLLGLAPGLLTAQAPSPAPDQAQFQGEIEVREIGIVVEAPEGKSLDAVRPEDILVFEDGAPRQAVKAEPLRPGASPWSIVLYFDRTLASPQTVHDAALVLSRQARELADLGTVEIVTAHPAPKVELPATRDVRSLSAILGGIAAGAQKEIRPGRTAAQPVVLPPALMQKPLDRLAAFLGGRSEGSGGAHALFLVADAFVPPPGEAALLTGDPGAPVPPGSLAAVLRETSRVLAGYGWVTFAGPFRDTSEELQRRQMGDMDRIRVMAGGSQHTNGTPPVIAMPSPDRGVRGDERVANVFSRPDSAPWLALAQPTSGTVLGVGEQLGAVIDGLARRWRVWYRAPESLDGQLRLVEVRLPSAAEPLRGPRWVRSSTPEGLAAARARLLADDVAVSGGSLAIEATLTGRTLKLRLSPAAALPPGPVRITYAFDNATEVRHVVVPDANLEKGWEHTLEIQSPPQGAQRVAVVVENLARGAWGGAKAGL